MVVFNVSGRVLAANGYPVDARDREMLVALKGASRQGRNQAYLADPSTTIYNRGTWLAEEPFNSHGGMNRVGMALCGDGILRRVHCATQPYSGASMEAWAMIGGKRVRGFVDVASMETLLGDYDSVLCFHY